MKPANDNNTADAWTRYCAEILRLRFAANRPISSDSSTTGNINGKG